MRFKRVTAALPGSRPTRTAMFSRDGPVVL